MQAASTAVKEIQAAIEQLSLNEQFEILAWLSEHANAGWDREMEEDAAAGRLDDLLKELDRNVREGQLYDALPGDPHAPVKSSTSVSCSQPDAA